MAAKRIQNLGMHCDSCCLEEWCGNPSCYAICEDTRFHNVLDSTYHKIASSLSDRDDIMIHFLKTTGEYWDTNSDCDIVKQSGISKCEGYRCDACNDANDSDCYYYDAAKDKYCENIALYVAAILKKRKAKSDTLYKYFSISERNLL